MRLLVTLQAGQDAAYNPEYHHKLRGRIGRPLKDTVYASGHGDSTTLPTQTMSNIFSVKSEENPWQNGIEEDREYKLVIASYNEDVLTEIADDLTRNPDFNVGDMEFTVTDLTPIDMDVGEPGTEGVLTTDTGVLVRIHDNEYDTYGINPDGNPPYRCWEPEYTLEPFIDKIERNLAWKHDQVEPDYLPGPEEFDYQLFDEYDLIKTYGLDLEVTTGTVTSYIVSKWNLSYEVRDNHHRRHLNLALNTGIGERNGLGLGFVNPRAREDVYDTEAPMQSATPQ